MAGSDKMPTVLDKSYGWSILLGGTYMNFKNPLWLLFLIYNIIALSSVAYTIASVVVTVFEFWDAGNLSLMLKQFNFALIRIIVLGLMINTLLRSDSMDALFPNLKMYDYTVPLTEEQKEVIEHHANQYKFVTNFYKYLMYGASIIWIITLPILEIVMSEVVFRKNMNESIKFGKYLPVYVWHPYNPDYFHNFAIQYGVQVYFTFILCHSSIGLISSYVELSTFLVSSFKVLQMSLEDVTARARKMYNFRKQPSINNYDNDEADEKCLDEKDNDSKTSTGTVDIESLELCDNKEYQECLMRCLKENLLHHQYLRRSQERMHQIYGPFMLFLLIVGGVFIVTKAVTLLEIKNDGHMFRNTFRFAQSVMSFTSFVYIFCYYGEEIFQESSKIHKSLYFCSWYNNSAKFKKVLYIMMTCNQKALSISCGGLKTLNLNTFSEMCSATYSYFSILRGMKVD